MKYLAGFMLIPLMCGCISKDEVLRITSPDNRVDAIVVESDCGAPCSFGYEIRLAPKGKRNGVLVAYLDAAVRNEQAWGVNLKWLRADRLEVEYLRADYSRLLEPSLEVAGEMIEVSLRDEIEDPRPPAGGMEYNLHNH